MAINRKRVFGVVGRGSQSFHKEDISGRAPRKRQARSDPDSLIWASGRPPGLQSLLTGASDGTGWRLGGRTDNAYGHLRHISATSCKRGAGTGRGLTQLDSFGFQAIRRRHRELLTGARDGRTLEATEIPSEHTPVGSAQPAAGGPQRTTSARQCNTMKRQ